MERNVLTILKEKKKVMKVSMAALVGAMSLYAGASLCSVSAMKPARVAQPVDATKIENESAADQSVVEVAKPQEVSADDTKDKSDEKQLSLGEQSKQEDVTHVSTANVVGTVSSEPTTAKGKSVGEIIQDLENVCKDSNIGFSIERDGIINVRPSDVAGVGNLLEALRVVKKNDTDGSIRLTLNLNGCRFDDQVVPFITEMFKNNFPICEFNAGSGMNAGGVVEIAEALKANNVLQRLFLCHVSIRDEGAKKIAELLEVNTTIIELDLSGSPREKDKVFIVKSLKKNRSLKKLRLSDVSVDEVFALGEGLLVNTTLEDLEIQGFDAFNFVTLISLENVLKRNSSLRRLNLRCNDITDMGAKYIAMMLRVNKTLEELILGQNEIEDKGAIELGKALKVNSSLTKLDLGSNKIGELGATYIGEALKVNSVLVTLNLRWNMLKDNGAIELGEALKVNSSLMELDLGENEIGESGATAMGEALKVNSSLAKLDLDKNEIGESGATTIGEALEVNSSLTELDLGKNEIGESGAMTIGGALKANSSLTKLSLRVNRIEESGATAIVEALKVNSVLVTLDLCWNMLRDNGAIVLGAALKVNSSLTDLDLKENNIGESGATAIGEALKVNSSLTKLVLSENEIENNGLKAIVEAIKINSVLTEFELSYYFRRFKITKEMRSAIVDALESNITMIRWCLWFDE